MKNGESAGASTNQLVVQPQQVIEAPAISSEVAYSPTTTRWTRSRRHQAVVHAAVEQVELLLGRGAQAVDQDRDLVARGRARRAGARPLIGDLVGGLQVAAADPARRGCPCRSPSRPPAGRTWACRPPAGCRTRARRPSCAAPASAARAAATTSSSERALGGLRAGHLVQEVDARDAAPASARSGGAEATSSAPSTVRTSMPSSSAYSAARSKFITSPP